MMIRSFLFPARFFGCLRQLCTLEKQQQQPGHISSTASSIRRPGTTSDLASLQGPNHGLLFRQIRSASSRPEGTVSITEVCHGRTLELEIGKLAHLADGSCVARLGGTHVLTTVVCSGTADPEADGMPLQVDYVEGAHTSACIPATHNRREARPGGSVEEVLCARAIDRALRPLFLPGFLFETHICSTVLSVGKQTPHPEVLAINAASAALTCSDIPWGGPVGAVRVGLNSDGEPVIFPNQEQLDEGGLKMLYAGTADKAMMLEVAANQISEQTLVRAMEVAQEAVAGIVASQLRQAAAVGRTKRATNLSAIPDHLVAEVLSAVSPKLAALFSKQRESLKSGASALSKLDRSKAQQAVWKFGVRLLKQKGAWVSEDNPGGLSEQSYQVAFDAALSHVMRRMAIDEAVRVDGRGLGDIRKLACEVALLPSSSVHGSALFDRGDTQVLCVATVGNEDAVLVDRSFKAQHFFLQYTFPPFSVNEAGKVGAPNRREIGHGALAEKALAPLMPHPEVFPFAVLLHADTLASNGSSSMAAVCSGSLALRNAGVPVLDLAAGISMGLLTEWGGQQCSSISKAGGTLPGEPCWQWPESYGRHALITDVQGAEDQLGDMDFKVAGTRTGITAVQLDIKLPGVPLQVLADALHPARTARLELLDLMESCSTVLNPESDDLPKYETILINKDYKVSVMGPKNEQLRKIEERCGVRMVVSAGDDADVCAVHMYGPDAASVDAAKAMVAAIEGTDMVEGQVYAAKVSVLHDVGALLEMSNGTRHYLHIGEVSHTKFKDIRNVLKEGQELQVKCIGRDPSGLVKLSSKAVLPVPSSTVGKAGKV